jgi:hypothetical protein
VFSKARLTVCDLLLVSTNCKLPVFFGRFGGPVSYFYLLLLLSIHLILHRTHRSSIGSINAVAISVRFDGSSGSVHRN